LSPTPGDLDLTPGIPVVCVAAAGGTDLSVHSCCSCSYLVAHAIGLLSISVASSTSCQCGDVASRLWHSSALRGRLFFSFFPVILGSRLLFRSYLVAPTIAAWRSLLWETLADGVGVAALALLCSPLFIVL
jgi:hypothetical protein